MPSRYFFFGLAAVMWVTAPAAAQTARPERPYRGLFGGGLGDADQWMTLKLSASGGYNGNLLMSGAQGEGGSAPTDPGAVRQGSYAQAGGDVSYYLNRTRFGVRASGSTTQRRLSTVSGRVLGSYAGGVSAWFQVARRTRLTVSESSSIQPFLSYGFFSQTADVDGRLGEAADGRLGEPAHPMVPDFALAVGSGRQRRHTALASLTQGLTPRTSLSVAAGYDTAYSSLDAGNVTSYWADGRLSRQLRRGVGAHAGYRYREGRYGGQLLQDPAVACNLDIGLDYNRPLSFSRRTTLTFGTGATSVRESSRTAYRLTGNARLTHEFRRTWNAALAYSRDAGFLQNLGRPVFADSLFLSFAGFANRRVHVSTSVGGALGTVGVLEPRLSNDYNTVFGSSALAFGLTRYAALTASYSYYHYSFDRTVQLPHATGRQLNRQSVQGGLSLWLPMAHRSRRPDAAR